MVLILKVLNLFSYRVLGSDQRDINLISIWLIFHFNNLIKLTKQHRYFLMDNGKLYH